MNQSITLLERRNIDILDSLSMPLKSTLINSKSIWRTELLKLHIYIVLIVSYIKAYFKLTFPLFFFDTEFLYCVS